MANLDEAQSNGTKEWLVQRIRSLETAAEQLRAAQEEARRIHEELQKAHEQISASHEEIRAQHEEILARNAEMEEAREKAALRHHRLTILSELKPGPPGQTFIFNGDPMEGPKASSREGGGQQHFGSEENVSEEEGSEEEVSEDDCLEEEGSEEEFLEEEVPTTGLMARVYHQGQ